MPRPAHNLFRFDQRFIDRHRLIAGVDESGRGPLAGPVIAAAVMLPAGCRLRGLNDSKQLTAGRRQALYARIQRLAVAIGVGIVDHDRIDQVNIYQASIAAMKLALSRLVVRPAHVLVDGYPISRGAFSETGVIGGDAKSAHIAAASIIAKVTRDALMEAWDRRYPAYGFRRHKGYGTPEHLEALGRFGPCPIHRSTFSYKVPVTNLKTRPSVGTD